MPLPQVDTIQNLVTLLTRDESHVELSAFWHPYAGALTAAALPDAFARKKLKSKFSYTSGPRRKPR